MGEPTKTYYLRLTAELNRELRHRAVETGETLNDIIVAAIRFYLDTQRQMPGGAAADHGRMR